MTKAQLRELLETLVAAIDSANDACADEDRGRCDNSLVLQVWDSGEVAFGYGDWYANPNWKQEGDPLSLPDAIQFRPSYHGEIDTVLDAIALELEIKE